MIFMIQIFWKCTVILPDWYLCWEILHGCTACYNHAQVRNKRWLTWNIILFISVLVERVWNNIPVCNFYCMFYPVISVWCRIEEGRNTTQSNGEKKTIVLQTLRVCTVCVNASIVQDFTAEAYSNIVLIQSCSWISVNVNVSKTWHCVH